jgi:nucleolar protein 12
MTSQQQSLQGRASKLLGRAGAAQFKKREGPRIAGDRSSKPGLAGIALSPEAIVFEGYRASSKAGRPKDLKLGGRGGGKKTGKPKNRSSKRGTEWKKSGGKKDK